MYPSPPAATDGDTPTLIPDVEIALRGDYAFSGRLAGLTLGAGIRHRGESFADDANSLTVPDTTLVDLRGAYALGEGWIADLSVTNLEDERHVTGCQTVYVCSYGSGREVNQQVSRTW